PGLDADSDDLRSAGEGRGWGCGNCLQLGEGTGRPWTQCETRFLRRPASAAKVARPFSHHRVCEENRRPCEGNAIRIRHHQYSCSLWLLVRCATAMARVASRSTVRHDHAWPRRASELRDGKG